MDKLTALVEGLKAVSWPGVVLIMGFLFRKPIQDIAHSLREMAPRVNEIGLNGVKMAPATAQNAPAASASAEVLSPSPAMQEGLPDFLLPYIENVTKHADSLNLKPETREKFFIRQSAVKDVFLDFWRAYNAIFGSQIDLLVSLNAVQSMPDEVSRAHYQKAVQDNAGFYENYSYEQWIDFLVGKGFVRREMGQVVVTEFGRRFLEFIVNTRLSTRRIG